jgi:hypothetical protein
MTWVAQAKRALIPLLVPREDLPLSATLDAFGWSLMAAIGASVGGLAVSWLGTCGARCREHLPGARVVMCQYGSC